MAKLNRPQTGPRRPATSSRRQLLRGGLAAAGVTAAAAAATRAFGQRSAAPSTLQVASWTKTPGAAVASAPYGGPSPHEAGVTRELTGLTKTPISAWSYTPLQDLHGTVTPNGLFFERHHGGVPAIDPAKHALVVHGDVRHAMKFSMAQLLRFPAVSRFHFLECSGNGLTEWKAPTGVSVQQTHGLLSCCQWVGVPLSSVLADVGIKTGSRWLLAEGADAAAMTRSIPLDKAMKDCLLVYAQNGERLRPEQGYPLRLLVPGFEGSMNIKWLRRLKLSDVPFPTREETSKYTDLLPSGKAWQFTFVMEAKSVITAPSAGQTLLGSGAREIRGLAWSGRGRIRQVEVSLDGGAHWTVAKLDGPVLPACLTQFRLPWSWSNRSAVLMSRATDETGYVQPTLSQLIAVRGLRSVYHNNAIQAWRVDRDGLVHNVHA